MADPKPFAYKKRTSPVEDESRSPKQSRVEMMKTLYNEGDIPEAPAYEETPVRDSNKPAAKVEPVSEMPKPTETNNAVDAQKPASMEGKYPIMTLDKLEAMTPEQRKAAGFSEGLFQRKMNIYSEYPVTPKARFAVEPDLFNPNTTTSTFSNTATATDTSGLPALSAAKPANTTPSLKGMSERVRTRVEAKKAGTYWNADKTPATYWDEKSQTRKMRNETKSAPAQKETSKVKPMAYKGKEDSKKKNEVVSKGSYNPLLNKRGTPIEEAKRSAERNMGIASERTYKETMEIANRDVNTGFEPEYTEEEAKKLYLKGTPIGETLNKLFHRFGHNAPRNAEEYDFYKKHKGDGAQSIAALKQKREEDNRVANQKSGAKALSDEQMFKWLKNTNGQNGKPTGQEPTTNAFYTKNDLLALRRKGYSEKQIAEMIGEKTEEQWKEWRKKTGKTKTILKDYSENH